MIPVLTSFAAGDLLPADDNTIDCGGDSGAKCFKAGDVRVNEHIGLVSELLSLSLSCLHSLPRETTPPRTHDNPWAWRTSVLTKPPGTP